MMAPGDKVLSERLKLQKPDGEEQLESIMGRHAHECHAQPPPLENNTSRCKRVKEALETIQHITAGCKTLAGKAYMDRNNPVAGVVYRNISSQCVPERPRSNLDKRPQVMGNNQAKIQTFKYRMTSR